MKYTQEQKLHAQNLLAQNLSVNQVFEQTKISTPTLYRWRRELSTIDNHDNNYQKIITIDNHDNDNNYQKIITENEDLRRESEDLRRRVEALESYITKLKRYEERTSNYDTPTTGWKPPTR